MSRAAFLVPDPDYANTQQHGLIYNYRAIDGHASRHDVRWKTFIFNDYSSYAKRGEGCPLNPKLTGFS